MSEIKGDPTDWVDFVLERFVYNYKTHTVHWRSQDSEDGCGALISASDSNGYMETRVCGKNRKLHHVVWVLTTGNKPTDSMHIDHIDGDKKNNAHINLRLVDPVSNWHNTKSKGYHWDTKNKKWRASIMINRRCINLGRYNTEAEARAAYETAKKMHGFIHR